MLKIGDLININGRKALVCFNGQLYNQHYINVCFEDNDEYKVYQVIPVGEDYDIKAVTDKELLNSLTAIWVENELNNYENNS